MGSSALEPTADLAGAEHARLDALLEAMPLAVAVFDGTLALVATNARYRDLTGLDSRRRRGARSTTHFPTRSPT